jgi:hypothetical protein
MHLGTTVEDALASPCSQHTAIIKYFQDNTKHGLRVRTDLISDSSGVKIHGYFEKYSSGHLVLADHPGKNADTHEKSFNGKIRVLDWEWVDLPLARQWMYDCSESHGEECDNPMNIMRVIPDLLVDVRRKCIVEGRESYRYMALTYRLGNAAPFRLSLRDLDTFRKPAILEDVQILERLPLTVRHAILLVDKLGSEYLWTDVLCIVHDGPATFSDQLNKMSAIYAGAVVTIVATDGDGADGISGLHGISGPRDLRQAAFAIRDECVIIEESENVSVTKVELNYNMRGWTYQEYIMSPRKLDFMNQQAYWVSQCHQRRECDGRKSADTGTRIAYSGPSKWIRSGYPDLKEISSLFSLYNMRDLTYPEDALPAVSGLLAVLSRGSEGGFLYGLPERFFDICLGWRPSSYSGSHRNSSGIDRTRKLKPRRGSPPDRTSYNTTRSASAIPSWSWTAWQGEVWFERVEVARAETIRALYCETSPITEWHTGSEPSGCNPRRIVASWFADRKDIEQLKPLPEGWTRVEASVVFKESLERRPRKQFWRPTIYRHQRVATDTPTYWYYPFRMPEINESTPFKVPEQTRYLFCTTWKAGGTE